MWSCTSPNSALVVAPPLGEHQPSGEIVHLSPPCQASSDFPSKRTVASDGGPPAGPGSTTAGSGQTMPLLYSSTSNTPQATAGRDHNNRGSSTRRTRAVPRTGKRNMSGTRQERNGVKIVVSLDADRLSQPRRESAIQHTAGRDVCQRLGEGGGAFAGFGAGNAGKVTKRSRERSGRPRRSSSFLAGNTSRKNGGAGRNDGSNRSAVRELARRSPSPSRRIAKKVRLEGDRGEVGTFREEFGTKAVRKRPSQVECVPNDCLTGA